VADRLLAIDEIMGILGTTVPRVTELTDRVPPARLHSAPDDGWSVNDVLAHLRACHDVLGGSILRILGEDHPAWKGMNPRAWIKQTDYPDWRFEPALTAFRAQRAEILAVLEPLAPDAWERTATVTGMIGDVYQRSARYYGDWMARHERGHIRHIARILAAVDPSAP
jgi:hypothetical protein